MFGLYALFDEIQSFAASNSHNNPQLYSVNDMFAPHNASSLLLPTPANSNNMNSSIIRSNSNNQPNNTMMNSSTGNASQQQQMQQIQAAE
jgi:hypothetical protein